MPRAEHEDGSGGRPPAEYGRAESDLDDESPDSATLYLYLPDLSSRTGWAAWRVRRAEPEERTVGFRPR